MRRDRRLVELAKSRRGGVPVRGRGGDGQPRGLSLRLICGNRGRDFLGLKRTIFHPPFYSLRFPAFGGDPLRADKGGKSNSLSPRGEGKVEDRAPRPAQGGERSRATRGGGKGARYSPSRSFMSYPLLKKGDSDA